MSSDRKPSMLSAILIAGGISLAISLTRLVSELQGWAPAEWHQPGGGGSWLGIGWLIFVFGFWFGRRIAKGGGAPQSLGKSFGLLILGIAGMVGMGMFAFGDMENRGHYIWVVFPALALFGLFAWPQAFVALLLYGVLARIPIVVIQILAIDNRWGTHYEKLPPNMPETSAEEVKFILTMAQVSMWIPATILLGGVCAVVGAATVRRK